VISLKSQFIDSYETFQVWWETKGRVLPTPTQGSKIETYHIQPLRHGGTNDFENMVLLYKNTQQYYELSRKT
jgi:hypothetical protein